MNIYSRNNILNIASKVTKTSNEYLVSVTNIDELHIIFNDKSSNLIFYSKYEQHYFDSENIQQDGAEFCMISYLGILIDQAE